MCTVPDLIRLLSREYSQVLRRLPASLVQVRGLGRIELEVECSKPLGITYQLFKAAADFFSVDTIFFKPLCVLTDVHLGICASRDAPGLGRELHCPTERSLGDPAGPQSHLEVGRRGHRTECCAPRSAQEIRAPGRRRVQVGWRSNHLDPSFGAEAERPR